MKTLHPAVHAGILAKRDDAAHVQQLADQSIKPIDLVIVNLYPFELVGIRMEECFYSWLSFERV